MNFDLSKCTGFITSSANKTITEDFNRRMIKYGSTRIQWIALYFLINAEKEMSQKELASLMNIKTPSLARLVDRMERDGLIKRIENQTDKRVKILELTEEGKLKAERLMHYGEEFSNLLLEDISDEEVEIFYKVLDKMLNNIEKEQ